ncbi:hypothetical protein KK062_28155 [Fulvivirgaceae bacterium PWU5]|uniref:SRPBCC family protein n=1 Tax=Dawidia cretensis TaxID=2782350 RepID=A0AAP2E5D7_9BACT|nr:hypothetical protein [Dawidia cretensis]MBT1712147.1 hypothetical protein [Dawidia cretensis]
MENEVTGNPGARYAVLKGIVFSNIFAVVAFALAYWLANYDDMSGGILSLAEFVLVPIGMGIIAMWYWRRRQERLVALLPFALLNTVIAIMLSAVFMGEGVICLIIVSPLLLGFMWVGVFIGKYIFNDDQRTFRVSTLCLYIILFFADVFAFHGHSNIVSDEMIIQAPPNVVWNYVAAHPLNTTEPDYWLFSLGLPCPVQSTVSGFAVGDERKCIFSNGATFDEVIVESVRDSVFTFDIVKQPHDPEIIGHINIERGQFILTPRADGTTLLTGNSWYTLKVYPAWYYDLWAVDITRHVHLRAMDHIKRLAEKDVQVHR